MIVNTNGEPQTTFADVNPGQAYRNGINDPLMKTQTPGTAVRLDTGQIVANIPDADVANIAPNAEVVFYPTP